MVRRLKKFWDELFKGMMREMEFKPQAEKVDKGDRRFVFPVEKQESVHSCKICNAGKYYSFISGIQL